MRSGLNGFFAILLASTIVLGVMPSISRAQPALPAIWVEPESLNFNTTSTSVGDKFNVTVWGGATIDVFTWQAEVMFNTTQLAAVRAAYTGGATSQWFQGHITIPISPMIDNTTGTVTSGESLLGVDAVHASNGSLFWIEFQILIAPTVGTTFASLIDTNDPVNSYLLDSDLNTMGGVILEHATYTFSGGTPPPTRHDAAIVSVTPSDTHPVQNDTVSIAVVVLNNGTVTETFEANATYNGALIGTQTATDLAAGATQTLTFEWNTTGVTPTLYTLTATAAAIPEDADLTNNAKSATVTVQSSASLATDINGDGKVDMKDVGIVAKAFGTSPGDPRWNPAADINGDGSVNLFDIALVSKDFWKQ
jgi:hypothetical protein